MEVYPQKWTVHHIMYVYLHPPKNCYNYYLSSFNFNFKHIIKFVAYIIPIGFTDRAPK